ncbi:MAG: hypothetical protein QNK23_10495 [Crocinitomicaceae bacterium]|nr:hypothetical protein [Crocinitomicaceae bacterium]
MSEKKKIILTKDHYASDVPIFTGRPQGRIVRSKLDFERKDGDSEMYEVHIPKGTLGFNASFYLGLFYPSYKALTPDGFHEKYKLIHLEEDEVLCEILKENIAECDVDAINEYNGKSGLDF